MKKVKIPAQLDHLDEMLDFIIGILDRTQVTDKYKSQIRLACEEALVNVIKYAYQDTEGKVEIRCSLKEKEGSIWIQIISGGEAYNPLLAADPDISLAIEDRKIGGLGVYMYKQIMDEVGFDHKGGKNVLTLSRRL